MNDLLRKPEIPDAVYCMNDHLAFGVIDALLENGFRVPQQVSVIGNNNMSGSEFFKPSLSSVDMKLGKCGEFAANTLLSVIKGNPVDPMTYGSIELIVRASSRV